MPIPGVKQSEIKAAEKRPAPPAKAERRAANPLKGFPGPPQRSIEQAAKKPIQKAGRSEKALKREATNKAFSELSSITRRNLSEGLSPQKAVAQATKAVTGNVGEAPLAGKTIAQRQLETRERKDFYKQQREDVAKTVQEHVLGIPVGPKKSPIEAGL